jgi:lysyl-tRNA synthetase class 2
MAKLSEQELIRREKLEELKKLGINPYPAALFPVNFYSNDLPVQYQED